MVLEVSKWTNETGADSQAQREQETARLSLRLCLLMVVRITICRGTW